MKKYEHTTTPERITNATLKELCDLWEATSSAAITVTLATVRGWLMDEFERRNPEGFNAWLDQDAPEDDDLRRYIHQFPALTKENAVVGRYYDFGGNGGYQIVRRIYRLSEEYAKDNCLMFLDRVETVTSTGGELDFPMPGGDTNSVTMQDIRDMIAREEAEA